jgi:hypothetical protein
VKKNQLELIFVFNVVDFSGLEADDPRLIEYICQHVLVPPSTEPYNLYYGINHDPSDGQSKVVDELLNHKVIFTYFHLHYLLFDIYVFVIYFYQPYILDLL